MNNLAILIGLPGCGKSTYARERLQNHVVVSTDEIRKELAGSLVEAHRRKLNPLVFSIFHSRIHENLNAGLNVVADATNLEARSREQLCLIAEQCGAEVHNYLFRDVTEAIARNKDRDSDAIVPDEAMKRMMVQFYEAVEAADLHDAHLV